LKANNKNHVFERSGIAAISDLQTQGWKAIYSILEEDQNEFLAKEDSFRSPDYKWPRDPLHTWSRLWEYPYVYHNLRQWREKSPLKGMPEVADVGSGVTFFPFTIAKLGCHVHCLDIDPTCSSGIERATEVVQHQPGKVSFRLISNKHIPLEDSQVDAVYCVSVLEHIPDFERTIKEVSRILKPNGLFILTIDLDLCGYMNIGVNRYYDMRRCFSEYFDLKEPEITVHPLDMLKPQNGLFPYLRFSVWQKLIFHLKQRIKPLFGKKPFYALPNLAVWGSVMTKKKL